MAIPPQSAALLQKAALFDVVVGLARAGYGLVSGTGLLVLLGAALAVTGLAMVAVARSQRTDPEGPISS